MRKFIHKKLLFIATQTNQPYYGYQYRDGDIIYHINRKLIEDSSDREEVVEKDWISDLYNFLVNNEGLWQRDGLFREAIEKYVPKPKKFTRGEIEEASGGYSNNNRYWAIYNLLKQHNLLSEDTEGETSE